MSMTNSRGSDKVIRQSRQSASKRRHAGNRRDCREQLAACTVAACTVFSACLVVFCQRLSRFVLPKSLVIQDPPLFVLLPAPLARLRTQTSWIRNPNSILVFFHFLSYLTCPSSVLSSAGQLPSR